MVLEGMHITTCLKQNFKPYSKLIQNASIDMDAKPKTKTSKTKHRGSFVILSGSNIVLDMTSEA